MNKHIKQIYNFHLDLGAPISQLRVYVASAGIHDEVEWDDDDGLTLQYEESFRYKTIQEFFDKYIKWTQMSSKKELIYLKQR